MTSSRKTACFTGHRPKAFPWGENKGDPRCRKMLDCIKNEIEKAIGSGVTHFICGNALGADTWAAELVVELKQKYPEITLEIALPFQGHNAKSSACAAVQKQADLVHAVSGAKNYSEAYDERNRYMADHSHMLIAVIVADYKASGGTYRTIRYAKGKGIPVVIIQSDGTVRNE